MTAAAAQPSTLQTVATNLINLIQATAALKNTDVSWGGSLQDLPDEMIAFDVEEAVIESASIGQQKRDEQYDLLIHILVNQNDPEGFNPLVRAFALRDAIAAIVRADATIGGALNLYALDQGWTYADGGDGNWSGTHIIMKLHCRARI